MAAVTLEVIKARQDELAQMISAFEAANEPSEIVVPHQVVTLRPGERYAGIILGGDGMPSHHLVLLPGEAGSADWIGARKFAEMAGGDLPSAREIALLFVNLRDEFKPTRYWCLAPPSADKRVWCQDFSTGVQECPITEERGGLWKFLHARAVRRIFF